jgi:hypothetical protein
LGKKDELFALKDFKGRIKFKKRNSLYLYAQHRATLPRVIFYLVERKQEERAHLAHIVLLLILRSGINIKFYINLNDFGVN